MNDYVTTKLSHFVHCPPSRITMSFYPTQIEVMFYVDEFDNLCITSTVNSEEE